MAEWDTFRPVVVKAEAEVSIPGSEGALRIVPKERGLFVLGLIGTPNAGQPKRCASPAVELAPGQYARFTVNARHTTYSGQYYFETVYNVVSGTEIKPDRFLSHEPDQDIDLKANLF
jgi:hypothetical protein